MVHHAVAQRFVQWAWRVLLVAVLIGNSHHDSSAKLQANGIDCVGKSCLYLPAVFLNSPPPVRLLNYFVGPSRSRATVFVAHIENVSQTPIYSVSVRANLYDAANNLVTTGVFAPIFSATLPDQINIVDRWMDAYYQDAYRVEAYFESYSLVSPDTFISQTVVFSPALSEHPNKTTGYIYNTQAVTISNIKVVVSTNCGIQINFITNTIKPGGFITYTHSRCFYDFSHVPPQELLGAQAQLLP